MEITDVQVTKIDRAGLVKAIASITIDDEFVVSDIRVVDGPLVGMSVIMPAKRQPNGRFRDIAHPVTANARSKIQAAILAEYYRVIDKMESQPTDSNIGSELG